MMAVSLTAGDVRPTLGRFARSRAFMNEPDPFTANTPNYRYGFLAAALHRLLERPIGSPLAPEELRQLALAKTFLADVLAGARLVSKGETRTVSATRAIGAL